MRNGGKGCAKEERSTMQKIGKCEWLLPSERIEGFGIAYAKYL